MFFHHNLVKIWKLVFLFQFLTMPLYQLLFLVPSSRCINNLSEILSNHIVSWDSLWIRTEGPYPFVCNLNAAVLKLFTNRMALINIFANFQTLFLVILPYLILNSSSMSSLWEIVHSPLNETSVLSGFSSFAASLFFFKDWFNPFVYVFSLSNVSNWAVLPFNRT